MRQSQKETAMLLLQAESTFGAREALSLYTAEGEAGAAAAGVPQPVKEPWIWKPGR